MERDSWITSRPGNYIWMLGAIILNATRIPFWMAYFLLPALRQHRGWTYRQALQVRIMQSIIYNLSLVKVGTPFNLQPGKEGDQFVILHPANPDKYVGSVARDVEIRPATIGGTWYPKRPESMADAGDVVLHLHGGAYVLGNGRIQDSSFTAKNMVENSSAKYVFCPQYRISNIPGGRFPAALQDAVTALLYLTDTCGIPASRLIVSGDSAGGNLCFALLRYIADNPDLKLPNPCCAWLWSPWVDPQVSLIEGRFDRNPNKPTDYLTGNLGAWGARAFAPSNASGMTLAHPNICFVENPFATPTPLFISVGECEVLYGEDLRAFEGFRAVPGNKVELQVEPRAVHDVITIGKLVGFEKEATWAAKGAGEFLRSCR